MHRLPEIRICTCCVCKDVPAPGLEEIDDWEESKGNYDRDGGCLCDAFNGLLQVDPNEDPSKQDDAYSFEGVWDGTSHVEFKKNVCPFHVAVQLLGLQEGRRRRGSM